MDDVAARPQPEPGLIPGEFGRHVGHRNGRAPGGIALVDRRAAITALVRKYADPGEGLAGVLAWAADAEERLSQLDVSDEALEALTAARDEVEAAWTWAEPILERWSRPDHRPRPYPSGTNGPSAATTLLERDSRSWPE